MEDDRDGRRQGQTATGTEGDLDRSDQNRRQQGWKQLGRKATRTEGDRDRRQPEQKATGTEGNQDGR